MTRDYRAESIDPGLVDELIELARRAPSAGNTTGTFFVVLEGDDVQRYWAITLPAERRASFPWPGLLAAPVLVLPCGDSHAYVERYGEDDKAKSGLGAGVDAWSIPYWHVDTAMAAMTLLHAAVDRGLGALFFGLFGHEGAVSEEFSLPDGVRPIGTIALGWPGDSDRPSKSASRPRPPLDEVRFRGTWGGR